MKQKLCVSLFALYCVAAGIGIGFTGASTTGCVSVSGTNRLDVARVASIAGKAAQIGSMGRLQKHPEERPYFVSSYNALGALDHASNYDPAAFAEALKMLPIKELSGPDGNLYVLGAVFLWDELAQQSYALDRTLWVQPVLRAVRLGIGRALGIAPGTKQRGLIP